MKVGEKTWNDSPRLVRKMFKLNGDHQTIRCPCRADNGVQCEAVPHMAGTSFGRNVPPESSSGPGLTIHYNCEEGHEWNLVFTDHSGSTSIELEQLNATTWYPHPLEDLHGNLPPGYDPVANPVNAVPFSKEDTEPLTLSIEWVDMLAGQARAIADRLSTAQAKAANSNLSGTIPPDHEDSIRIALMMMEDNGRVADRLLAGMFPNWREDE